MQKNYSNPLAATPTRTDVAFASGSISSGGLPIQPHKEKNVVEVHHRYPGIRHYELTDHLGNVRVVFSDRKIATDSDSDGSIDSYSLDVESWGDYYAFGMPVPGRTYNAQGYKFGFNGKEKDDEGLGGGGATYDYGFRIYNPQIARFLSVDPLISSYPMLAPYQYASNSPVALIDIDGLEGGVPTEFYEFGNYITQKVNNASDNIKVSVEISLSNLGNLFSKDSPEVSNPFLEAAFAILTINLISEVEQRMEELRMSKMRIDLTEDLTWMSQFNPYFGTEEERRVACWRACAKIASDYGITNPGPNNENLIQTAVENQGILKITEDAHAGIDLLNSQLEDGNPVIVGVNHTLGNTYNEGTTDHFVLIVGREEDENGDVYYRFFEVGSYYESYGTNEENRFLLNSDGSLTGQCPYNENRKYTVTQIRQNEDEEE